MSENKIKKELSVRDYEFASVTNTYTPEMLKGISKHSNAITTALSSIAKNYEKVIFNLYWIYRTKSYISFGYDSILTYASDKFGFKKSSTYDFLNLAERFGNDNFDAFDNKYKDYTHSKLSLIADKSDSEINDLEINPDMSVKEIKALVKKHDSVSKSVQDSVDNESGSDSEKPNSQESLVINDNEVSLPDSSGSAADNSIEDIKIDYYGLEEPFEFYGWFRNLIVKDYLDNHINLLNSLFSDNEDVTGFANRYEYKASILFDNSVVRFFCKDDIFDVSFERLSYEKFIKIGFDITIYKGKKKIKNYQISSLVEDNFYNEFMKYPDCKITITLNNSNDNEEKGGKDT